MASSISLHSPFLPSRPFSTPCNTRLQSSKPRTGVLVFAAKKDSSGHMVDENMIVLRKRIHEMKMVERNYEAPSEWMEWEKRYYTNYDAYICEAMGFLQSHLMNTRPSFALGLMALVTLSVPISTAVLISNTLEIAKGVFQNVLIN